MLELKKITYTYTQIIGLLFLCYMMAGCATIGLPSKTPPSFVKRRPLNENERERLLKIAKEAIGQRDLKISAKSFRRDCSGTIRAFFTKAKIGLGGIIKHHSDNDVKTIYRYVQKYGSIEKKNPRPGDLVFFHNTYDRSKSGLMNDALTHIGLVEKIEGSTIHFIHHFGETIIRSRMNLSFPKDTHDKVSKERINHILRRAQGPYRAYTGAELFAGFGRL